MTTKLGIVKVSQTNHVLALFTSRGRDPSPGDVTGLVDGGFPLRDTSGAAALLLPTSELATAAVTDDSPDRVAQVLGRPQGFRYDDDAKSFVAVGGTVSLDLTKAAPPITVSSGTGATLKYLIVVQDSAFPGNAGTAYSGTVLDDAQKHAVAFSVATGQKVALFVEGLPPLVQTK